MTQQNLFNISCIQNTYKDYETNQFLNFVVRRNLNIICECIQNILKKYYEHLEI